MQAVSTVANASATSALASAAGEYLTFRLGSEAYGIEILAVQEIRGFETPTRMANAPSHVLGVQNLRGVIVPILDLRMKFGMADVVYGTQTVTIVLSLRNRVVGVVVDAVSDVVALAADQIREAPGIAGGSTEDAVIGIATLQQQDSSDMLILLDIEQLMGTSDMGLVTTQSLQ